MIDHVVTKPKDLPIEHRFLAAKNLISFSIDIYDVPEEPLPLWMVFKGIGHLGKHSGTVTIISVEDRNDFTGCASGALIHRMGVAFVPFRNPHQARILLKQLNSTISRTAIYNHVLDFRIILTGN